MSGRHGYIRISRKLYADCPFWNEPRIYSRHEAWEDFIQMAAWKPHERIVGGEVVRLERGELLASVRFLSKRWNWSSGRVFRWLKLVQRMGRIRHGKRTANGDTYLLVNYESYQSSWNGDSNSDGNEHGTLTEQRRNKEKEGNEGKKGNSPSQREQVEIPAVLSGNGFLGAWKDWLDYRRERRFSVRTGYQRKTLKWCSEIGAERAIEAIRFTIQKDYQGLTEDRYGKAARGPAGAPRGRAPIGTDDERREQIAKLD